MTKKQETIFGSLPAGPCYIFDEDCFVRRAARVRQAFGEKVGLCFSMKANPFLLGSLPEAIDRIEVCSPGELTICERIGADPSAIIFSGVNKTLPDIERAMDDRVGTFTAESRMHVDLLNACAQKRGIRVPVLLRLTGGSQFGMDAGEVLDIIRRREEYPGMEIVGLHYFTGTQKRKPSVILKELLRVERFLQQVETECGFLLQRVEYGTGLAVDYFSDCDETADHTEEERLDAIAPGIRALGEKTQLTVEMGRFFAAPCGFYTTQIIDTKKNENIAYAICDGGLHQLKYDGQIQGMQIPVLTHFSGQTAVPAPDDSDSSEENERWTLCGSLCTTADVLARDVPLHNLRPGDRLVFHRTGAYSVMEGMAVFLSRDMPAVYLYSEQKGLRLVRPSLRTDGWNTPVSLSAEGRAEL